MSQYQKGSTSLKPFLRPTIDDLVAANSAFQSLQLQHNKTYQSVDEQNIPKPKLKKALTLRDMIFFGICLTIGTGVFVLTGIIGKNYSGPGIIITNLISSMIVGISAMAYIEFSSRISVIGGSYTFAMASNGELIGFISGFGSIIADPVSSSVSTIGCLNYLKSFLQVIGVKYFDKSNLYWTGHKLFNTSWISINLSAPILNICLCITCLFGITLSSRFMNIMSVFNLSLILLFIISGLFYIDSSNWFHPCDNHRFDSQGECPSDANNTFMPFGIDGVIAGSAICLWSYVGIGLF